MITIGIIIIISNVGWFCAGCIVGRRSQKKEAAALDAALALASQSDEPPHSKECQLDVKLGVWRCTAYCDWRAWKVLVTKPKIERSTSSSNPYRKRSDTELLQEVRESFKRTETWAREHGMPPLEEALKKIDEMVKIEVATHTRNLTSFRR